MNHQKNQLGQESVSVKNQPPSADLKIRDQSSGNESTTENQDAQPYQKTGMIIEPSSQGQPAVC